MCISVVFSRLSAFYTHVVSHDEGINDLFFIKMYITQLLLEKSDIVCGWLVDWFYDISKFVGYFTPNPFSYSQFYFKQFSLA